VIGYCGSGGEQQALLFCPWAAGQKAINAIMINTRVDPSFVPVFAIKVKEVREDGSI
jgi:hypothetical protein